MFSSVTSPNSIETIVKKEEIKHPNRYNKNGIEVWEVEKAFSAEPEKKIPHFVEHLRFGAVEYLLRCWDKNGVEDIRKAMNLCGKMLEEMDGIKVVQDEYVKSPDINVLLTKDEIDEVEDPSILVARKN
jgi:hypothetical protein